MTQAAIGSHNSNDMVI